MSIHWLEIAYVELINELSGMLTEKKTKANLIDTHMLTATRVINALSRVLEQFHVGSESVK